MLIASGGVARGGTASGRGPTRIRLETIMNATADVPCDNDEYEVTVGTFEEFFEVLRDPGTSGDHRCLANAVLFIDNAWRWDDVSVSIAYDRPGLAVPGSPSAGGTSRVLSTSTTMAGWLHAKVGHLLEDIATIIDDPGTVHGLGRAVDDAERRSTEINGVLERVAKDETLQLAFFADDDDDVYLPLAVANGQRAALLLENRRVRLRALSLTCEAVKLLLVRDFRLAVWKKNSQSVSSNDLDNMCTTFRTCAYEMCDEILAGLNFASCFWRASHVETGPYDEMKAFARRLNSSVLSDALVDRISPGSTDRARQKMSEFVANVCGGLIGDAPTY